MAGDREFEFTLEGKDESTPMPAETKATVGKPEQGAKADFAFGDIPTLSRACTSTRSRKRRAICPALPTTRIPPR
ncbi:hypothetical protein LF916_01295 [Bifidobacterium pseudolongum]|uniref:hypothetical protein n=1 Tax=Bifidobacterium pseudolongum TaxID=1694 RepID=UPI001F0ED081|nr:hypothetical protein [Bifidobacterium pseudolongum]MCH4859533.1 hypothetical protein [Bifidobacterium pseudolongum]MCH4861304.1 hypothetical protein [Bifidobacterium pseudolongum]